MHTQPPVLSPLTLKAVLGAAVAGVRGRQPLDQLRALLLQEFRAHDVLLTGSGTDALQLAIRLSLKDAAAPIVALPAFSCYDVASAAIGAAARIVLYDVAADTLAPQLDALEHAFRLGARAAVIAPLYGVPVPWPELSELAARHHALLIEDAAQGHGASCNGMPLGSIGALSVLSFGRGKGWTGGGGGALLCRGAATLRETDLRVAESGVVGGVISSGKAAAQWLLARPALYGLPASLPWLGLGETVYRKPAPPRHMAAGEAALLLASRARARAEITARRTNAGLWRAALHDVVHTYPDPAGGCCGYLRFPVRHPTGVPAADIVDALRQHGVAASYPTTLRELPAVQDLLVETAEHPGASTLVRELFTLPTHSSITSDDRSAIVAQLKSL